MDARKAALVQAVERQDVPFVVAMTANADGVTWSDAVGDAAPGRAAGEDTVFRIFSMTKAIGSTAAMLLIDRGRLDAETPVDEILPEWKERQVLEGFDGDKPRLRPPKTRATVRHLATHTSGLEYEFWNGTVADYLARTGAPPVLSGLRAGLDYPLMTDPGTRWGYGMSIDWLGMIVEKIDGRRIDRYCREELFEPLGMTDTVYEPSATQQARLASVAIRGESGQFGPFEIAPPAQPEVYGMGHALYSTAPDYLRFLRMFLNRGSLDGRRILSEGGVEWMLADRMNGLTLLPMISVAPAITADFEAFPGTRVVHSFGFARNEEDIPGKRSAGSQTWAGVLNTHYWFDPRRDVAAVLMTQTLPFGEPRFLQLYDAFERAVYSA